jgi:hypothetical protein
MEQHQIWIFWLLLAVKTELTSLSNISALRCYCWIEHSYLQWCFLNQCTYSYSCNLPSQPLCDGSLFGDYVSKQDLWAKSTFWQFPSPSELWSRIVTLFDKNPIFGEIWWVHYPETFILSSCFKPCRLIALSEPFQGCWRYSTSPPLACIYTPYKSSCAAWKSKWHAYAPPFYGHITPPPSCLAQPFYGGNVLPTHLSLCRSTPCSHTMAEQTAKKSMINLIFFKTH